jgi:hypothetical protein
VVTITKSITIDGGGSGGQVASILTSGGQNGIIINAGVADVITIRNISINGIRGITTGTGGLNGIRFLAGKALTVENVNISGFTNRGIDISVNNASGNPPVITVINTTCNDNGDSGIRSTLTQRALVTIVNSRFQNNGSYGVFAGSFSRFTVNGSDASANGLVGFIAQASAGDVVMNLSNSLASSNSTATTAGGGGIQAGGSTANSVLRISGVVIASNFPNGMIVGSNGNIVSFGNNYNSGNGLPTSTLPVM